MPAKTVSELAEMVIKAFIPNTRIIERMFKQNKDKTNVF